MADSHGATVCSARPLPAPVNISDRLSFVRAMTTQSFAMGEYQIGRVTGEPAINFASPVFDAAGRLKYVVLAALDLNWFGDLAERLQLPPGAVLSVFNADGVILVGYPDGQHTVGRRVPYADAVDTVLRHGPIATERVGLDGVRRIYGVTRLSVAPAYADSYLSVGTPVASAFAMVHRTFLTSLLWAGVIGLFAVLLALGGAALYVQRPLDALTTAAKRLAAGDLGARAGSASLGGELRPVIGAFDEMASALERRTTALHDAEAQYRALVEQSLAGVSILDAEKFIYVNDALAAIFGYRPEEMIGRIGAIDVAHPDDRPMVAEHVRRRLEGGGPMHYTFRGLRKDGRAVDVEVYGRGLVSQGRTVVMSTVLDVTAQKQARAQQARRAAEREAFYTLSQRLRAARTTADMYAIVVEQAMTLLGAAHVALNLLDAEHQQFETVHWSGLPFGHVGRTFPVAGTLSARVIESGASEVTDDLLTGPLPPEVHPSRFATFGPRAIVALRTEEGHVGTLMAVRLRETGAPFTEAEVRQLEGVAEIGGIAIWRADLAESLERRVRTLTALYGSAQRFAGNLDSNSRPTSSAPAWSPSGCGWPSSAASRPTMPRAWRRTGRRTPRDCRRSTAGSWTTGGWTTPRATA